MTYSQTRFLHIPSVVRHLKRISSGCEGKAAHDLDLHLIESISQRLKSSTSGRPLNTLSSSFFVVFTPEFEGHGHFHFESTGSYPCGFSLPS